MLIPTLETERLLLVAPSSSCWPAYERFYTDALASTAYGGPLTRGAAWARLSADLGSWHLQGFGVWAVQRKSDETFIGTCGFWQGKDWPKELTWWLLPECRGQGIAREASVAAVGFAYNSLGWSDVHTYMNDENLPARQLVVSLGGTKVRRQTFPDGLERDVFRVPAPSAA